MKHVKTIAGNCMHNSTVGRNCGECQTSCQSACKTSCTVGNQQCEKMSKK